MNVIGIVAEYNPFHNGHIYHINKIKELYPDSIIILVLSGYFTERGEISVLTKRQKTEIALASGVDLVVELPFKFAVQSADCFAMGSIAILNYLKVEKIVFGSESNDIQKLNKLAKTQINNCKYDLLVKEKLKSGINYPTALSNSLQELTGLSTSSPNDLLGISYIKEIIKNNYNIEAITLKRTNDYRSLDVCNNIASATSIRKKIKDEEEIRNLVPPLSYKYIIKNKIDYDKYFMYLKYKIMVDNRLSLYQTVDEGIENRLKKDISNVNNLNQLINSVKTKRYTYNKINRMFLHIFTSFTKEEASNKKIEYIRILGFNKKGKNYLNSIKKNMDVPIISNITKKNYPLLELEFRVSKLYQLLTDDEDLLKEESKGPVQF